MISDRPRGQRTSLVVLCWALLVSCGAVTGCLPMSESEKDRLPEEAAARPATEAPASDAAAGEPLADALPGAAAEPSALVGRWRRLTDEPCAEAYPERIEFREDGVYLADSEDQRFREWQAGDYELEAGSVRMQMSTDAMQPFDISFPDDEQLVFLDAGGCRIEYRRES